MGGLGLKNVQSFNLALLAKKCQRILKEPSSLVSKVLKPKYHPSSDFLDAKLGYYHSFVWRSLTVGRKLLKSGLMWRIENGKQAKIQKDKWLNSPLSNSIQSPTTLFHEDACVSDPIDSVKYCWKRDLLNQIFSRSEVTTISTIPLSLVNREDTLVWSPSKNNIFSIKSTYHYHHSPSIQNRGDQSSNRVPQKVWKAIWKLAIPNRIKTFIQRAFQESLPTYLNLNKRRITKFDLCPIYLHHIESVIHASGNVKPLMMFGVKAEKR